ncbi:UDP-N-acetylmuramate dehydrogenase [Zeaxanthinibacter enoshimensis]|uniref:UDP-N-acetylenolpyruvoylglucosamine reductase n=1 Tax=Zeaxanthinibacter enoshimensis TaxID=392009 RepID=A0A4R6TM23_9FLAO|nr:UDP-N-acetylmuramate dehydrogenase [Zeaxanthinibacter enoshimensis]TDQ30759.1 UDP-N-acetylmuramate dehydrogenase [Zeaxanthinibacter enoshimensis]
MKIQENISLRPYNTFGIDARARHFISVNTVQELQQALALEEYPEKFILGGGSNMLLVSDIEALVVHVNLKGISEVEREGDHLLLKVMAGENWHQLVLWTMQQDLGGLENLSLIPGNTGTAPIQNIGAYGVELKDVFHSCEAVEVATGKLHSFTKEECEFGYRESIFKNKARGKFVITAVTFRLSLQDHHLNTSYGAIEAELEAMGISDPGIQDVSRAVIAIRRKKLPDPAELGNSGSFFKNPVIDGDAFRVFQQKNPEAPFYKVSETAYKIPAGWMIEQCGFKGKRFGDAGVHKHQALVLVNHGNATGKEILGLAHRIQEAVSERFGITIQPEVNIIGN